MHLRTTLTALALAIALTGLTACGDDETAEPDKPAPTSASRSATPTGPAPPEMPTGVTQKTQGGAEATVRYWFESVTFAMATGDPALADALATTECATCRGLSRQIRKVARSGATSRGGGWYVERINHAASSTTTEQTFAVDVVQRAQLLVDREGKVTDRDPRQTFVLVITARWDRRWRIHEVVEAL